MHVVKLLRIWLIETEAIWTDSKYICALRVLRQVLVCHNSTTCINRLFMRTECVKRAKYKTYLYYIFIESQI